MDFSYRQTSAGATLLCLGAGVVWDDVVRFAVAHELAGIEAISGVPGWVGAAPIQNIGCYGQEVSETVRAVEAVEVSTGVRRRFTNDECGFRYRRSVFKNGERGRYVVTRVELALRSSPVGEVRYDEVIKVLGGTTASLGRIREAVLAIRRRKSMVLDAADPNSRSVGSFFLNPLISTAVYAEVATRAGAAGLGPVPHWPVDGGQVKLSAAWLIEATGFSRGWRLGRVSLSDRHVLAIVNRGGATAADVVALARQLRGTVRHTFGITLEPEPTFVGFAASVDELLE
jgi:UDP-N-acetylmuramate dehydrogenase